MPAGVKVWDLVVRVFHWCLAGSFLFAWFRVGGSRELHEWAGYAAGGLVALRLVWGVVGSRYAQFGQFVRDPLTILRYLRDIATGKENRYVGHNPAGGAMIVALLIGIAGIAITGYMMETDEFFGIEWVERTHGVLANVLLLLVCVHILGVIVASVRHHENLLVAMFTGRKREPGPDDIA